MSAITAITVIDEARELPDGRVGALIETVSNQTAQTAFVIFEEQDGRLLLDEIIENATEQVATPVS